MDMDGSTDQMLIDFLREDSDDVLLDTSVYGHQGPQYLQTKLLSDDTLEGEITVPLSPLGDRRSNEPSAPDFNTLDEPVMETLKRDLKAVGTKFFHVLYPKASKSLLKEWDLWGPLMLCISMSILLRDTHATDNDPGGPQFTEVFVIYWFGAGVVTLNIKLLGGSISVFQGVCVLGYCVLPLVGSLFLCRIILLASDGLFIFILRGFVVLAGLVWSVFASTAFLVECQPPKRKPLAIYPVFLFYFFISWIILSNFPQVPRSLRPQMQLQTTT